MAEGDEKEEIGRGETTRIFQALIRNWNLSRKHGETGNTFKQTNEIQKDYITKSVGNGFEN